MSAKRDKGLYRGNFIQKGYGTLYTSFVLGREELLGRSIQKENGLIHDVTGCSERGCHGDISEPVSDLKD